MADEAFQSDDTLGMFRRQPFVLANLVVHGRARQLEGAKQPFFRAVQAHANLDEPLRRHTLADDCDHFGWGLMVVRADRGNGLT